MTHAAPKFLTRIDNEVIRFAPFAILVFNEKNVVEIANSESLRILATSSDLTEVVGSPVTAVFPGVDFASVGRESLSRISTLANDFTLELQCVKVEHGNRTSTIVYLSQPVSQRERLLVKEASTDELSGLANRRAFQRTMESNQHRALSLAIVDIDQFKAINDVHGHPAGDQVIQLVASHLQNFFGENSVLVSRMGGDEFSVLFETDNPDSIVESLNDLREKIAISELPQRENLKFSVSVGVAISTRPATGSRVLLTRADQQLYKAKNAGRNQVAHILLDE